MKDNYTKPLLGIEVFSLTQSVMRECTNTSVPKDQLTSNDISHCKWDTGTGTGTGLGGVTIFVAGATCDLDGEQMDIACYNNYGEDNFIFRS